MQGRVQGDKLLIGRIILFDQFRSDVNNDCISPHPKGKPLSFVIGSRVQTAFSSSGDNLPFVNSEITVAYIAALSTYEPNSAQRAPSGSAPVRKFTGNLHLLLLLGRILVCDRITNKEGLLRLLVLVD